MSRWAIAIIVAVMAILGVLQYAGVIGTTDAPADPRWHNPSYDTH
jgi:hypothetical protein